MTAPVLNAAQTAAALPYPLLVQEISRLLRDTAVTTPPRAVLPLPGGGSLFVMPAHDAQVAITKLITFTPANAGTGRATIQGDVVVFDMASGARRLLLDGPTATARRTAAVSALAALRLAPVPQGPLLIVGAGVQGRSHLEAFAQVLGVTEVVIASRSRASRQTLADHARQMGLQAKEVDDPHTALADCPLVVTATLAHGVVLDAPLQPQQFVAAVGAFTPRMQELSPALCRQVAQHGRIVVDTADATHEAGDLLIAGLDVAGLPTLAEVERAANAKLSGGLPHQSAGGPSASGYGAATGPVLFKSCGWAGWDLAAARAAWSLAPA